MRDHAATSPGMAVEGCDDFACVVSQPTADEPAVEVAGCLRVELVDALDEKRIEFLAFALVAKFNGWRIHALLSQGAGDGGPSPRFRCLRHGRQKPTCGLEPDHAGARDFATLAVEEDRAWRPEQVEPFEERTIAIIVRGHVDSQQLEPCQRGHDTWIGEGE